MATYKTQSAYVGLPAVEQIPTNMKSPGVMSTTASAPECFINQRFSSKLQAFLISYVNSIHSNYPVYTV
jgi:hypothetical protein